jgi:hypothetical protein
MATAAEIEPIGPDERAFREHIARARFLAGVARGHWRIVAELGWPLVVFAIGAAPREGAPREYGLRTDLAGYPFQAPTSTPWDLERDEPLAAERRPKGHRVGHVFRADWNGGSALYAPYDRVALAGHGNWTLEHPRYAWEPTRDVAWFLSVIHDLLNDDDYMGV